MKVREQFAEFILWSVIGVSFMIAMAACGFIFDRLLLSQGIDLERWLQ